MFADAAKQIRVSIHAPVRGAMDVQGLMWSLAGFNSRTREGCDNVLALSGKYIQVSIHAPVRGAMGAAD